MEYIAALDSLPNPPELADRPDFLRQTTAAFRILLSEASLSPVVSALDLGHAMAPSMHHTADDVQHDNTVLASNGNAPALPVYYDTFYAGCLLDLELEEKEASLLRSQRDAASIGVSSTTAKTLKKVSYAE